MEGPVNWVVIEVIAFLGAFVLTLFYIYSYSRKSTERLARQAEIATPIITLIALGLAIEGYRLAIKAYRSDEEGRKAQKYNTAWLVVNSPGQPSVDGGRKKALEYLRDERQSLQGAELSNALLTSIDLDGMDLNRVNMRNADLFGADLTAASLWGGYMEQAIFQFARLEGVDFEHAHLDCADLRGAYLGQLELTEYLTNPEIRHQIFGDSNSVESTENRLDKVIGRIRNEYVTNEIKFITEMDGREMEGLDFKGVEIKTILVEASLQYAHLEGANLSNAQLTHANLSHAYLGKYKDRFYPDPHATYNNDLHRGNCSPAWPGVTGTRQRVTVRQPKSGCVKGRDMSQQIHDSRRPVPADL